MFSARYGLSPCIKKITFSLSKAKEQCIGVPRKFVRGRGFQQIQLRTEDRENGVLGAVAP